MGKPAARMKDMHICPMKNGEIPHKGGQILPGRNVSVLIEKFPAAVVGDSCVCVGSSATIVSGSATVLINGYPAARMGDRTSHGGTIVSGSPTVLIG